ncbi:hypothetical protein GWR56_12975 [Mucilaginibacter sp. 14171R-50]|uniref:hypothetical protein n=1 Tax=Mucilaginibacter sp. 14171R-50 TaxID=2703789 RepID=UPI00138B8635|nr:hypothetical protein [Mucilaginibacter sp. 14171R-50]QHS56406.1 hypothetical protein GWR56_12975 [Mucilaginibacter sp. 14171R-50]
MAPSHQVQDFPLLPEVFRRGLTLGLISREEIVLWADRIIADTDEPDYFFIEVSLSGDVNGLVEVLHKYVKPTNNPIYDRVLLGLIYHRQPIDDVEEAEKVAKMVGSMSSWDRLTPFENDTIYEFDEYHIYYSPDLTQLQVELSSFLAIYKAFTLGNYTQWVDINLQVLELLKEKEKRVNAVNESLRKAWAKKEKKRKLKLYLKRIGALVLLLAFFILMIALFDDNSTRHFMWYSILAYFCVRGGYEWWKRRKKLMKRVRW